MVPLRNLPRTDIARRRLLARLHRPRGPILRGLVENLHRQPDGSLVIGQNDHNDIFNNIELEVIEFTMTLGYNVQSRVRVSKIIYLHELFRTASYTATKRWSILRHCAIKSHVRQLNERKKSTDGDDMLSGPDSTVMLPLPAPTVMGTRFTLQEYLVWGRLEVMTKYKE